MLFGMFFKRPRWEHILVCDLLFVAQFIDYMIAHFDDFVNPTIFWLFLAYFFKVVIGRLWVI